MALFYNGLTLNGGAERDHLFGFTPGDHTINGGDNNDLILASISSFFLNVGGNTSLGAAAARDQTGSWSTTFNPMIGNSTTVPHATFYFAGEGAQEYYSVTVGAGETITADIDFATFDTILTLLTTGGAQLAISDDNSSDDGSQFSFVESLVSWTNDTGVAQTVIINISEFGGDGNLETDDAGIMHVSVTNHAVAASANDGNDTLNGGAGNDLIYGLGGNDFAFGDMGDDFIYGGDGNDLLDGQAGIDVVDGGAGDDLLYVQVPDWLVAGDMINGGDGFDSLVFFGTGSNVYNLGAATISNVEQLYFAAQAGGGTTVQTNAAQFKNNPLTSILSEARDNSNAVGITILMGAETEIDLSPLTFNANWVSGRDVITVIGFAQAAVIIGSSHVDELRGGDGDDTIGGAGGGDSLVGGDGVDIVSYALSPAAVAINLGALTASGGDAAGDTIEGFESVIGSNHHDTLTGDFGANTLVGLGGNDTLRGEDGDDLLVGVAGDDLIEGGLNADTISGGDGNDTIYAMTQATPSASGVEDLITGDAGADFIVGSGGADTISGGSGDDTISGGAGADSLTGEGGRDSLIGNDGNDFIHGFGSHDSLYGGNGDDDLRGGYGKDLLGGSGNNDVLRGFEGDDRLFGGGGNDTLLGNDDNDSLIGGGGSDRLKGDAGNDTLNGLFGDDLLTGGDGDDLFQFRKTHGNDTIDDFVAGGSLDEIQLVAFGAAFDTFAEVIAAATQVGGDTVIDFGGGDSLTLKGVTLGNLTAGDFVF